MKFSPNYRAKELGSRECINYFGKICWFLDLEGASIAPKLVLGKSLAGFFRSQLIRILTVFHTICKFMIILSRYELQFYSINFLFTCPRASKSLKMSSAA